MNEPKLVARLLRELFRRSQAAEKSDIIDLADACGASLFATLRALDALDRAGLADARRLHLTLSGLALVTAYSRRPQHGMDWQAGRPSPKARHAA